MRRYAHLRLHQKIPTASLPLFCDGYCSAHVHALHRSASRSPCARSLIEKHFAAAPGPLDFLDLAPPPDDSHDGAGSAAAMPASLSELERPPSAWLLAASALRAVRSSAVLRSRWGAAPFLQLLRHGQPDVQWVGAEGAALYFQLVRSTVHCSSTDGRGVASHISEACSVPESLLNRYSGLEAVYSALHLPQVQCCWPAPGCRAALTADKKPSWLRRTARQAVTTASCAFC